MNESRAKEAEDLFQKGYELLQKEKDEDLTTDRAFLKPLEKAAKYHNPKAEFILGYLLYIGYKDLPMDMKKGNKILKKSFGPLEDLSVQRHDYQAAKFLSEYYRVPLSGHVKDDGKVKELLALSDSYREASLSPLGKGEAIQDYAPAPGTVVKEGEENADSSSYDQLVRAISELKEDGSFDNAERLNSIKTSAENGNMRAALFLGEAYQDGKYVVKNPDTARLYFTKAEELGSIKAKFRLGKEAVEGNFTRQDVIKGLNKIYQAAKAGLPEAQHYLGLVYYQGKFVEKDISKAYVYFQSAFSRGYKDSEQYLRAIESQEGDKLLVGKAA